MQTTLNHKKWSGNPNPNLGLSSHLKIKSAVIIRSVHSGLGAMVPRLISSCCSCDVCCVDAKASLAASNVFLMLESPL